MLNQILFYFSITILCSKICYSQGLAITDTNPILIDFNEFRGNGFSPSPTQGQLNSNYWKVSGTSDGSTTFGTNAITGDFARGTSSGGVGIGGIYAFEVQSNDFMLGIQPIGNDFTPGSITIQLNNTTGKTIQSIAISYDVYSYNDQNRSNSFHFSHSLDDIDYIQEATLDYNSIEVGSQTPFWESSTKSIEINNILLSNNESYFLRWHSDDLIGNGSRDELGIDNVSIQASTISIPKITSFSPSKSPSGGIITITGSGFLEEPKVHQVRFNGTYSTFDILSDSEIRAVVPRIASTGKITVIASGFSDESLSSFHKIDNDLSNCTIGTRDLIISEYIEGSSNNKALEIYNGTGSIIDLSTYKIELYNNNNTSPNSTLSLSGTLLNEETHIIAHPNAHATILNIADQISGGVINFNGNDAIILRNNSSNQIIDAIGEIGNGETFAENTTLRRKPMIYQGDANANNSFNLDEWVQYPSNTFDGLQNHSINIGPPPIIELQPESICVDAASIATTISLITTSSEATGFQWRKWDGIEWVDVDAYTDGIDIHSGFTTSTLFITVAETPTMGARYGDQYYCEVRFNESCYENTEVAYIENGTHSPCELLISLPVELKLFNILTYENTAKILWETSTEINNLGFSIEKSIDGIAYESIGFVNGKNHSPSHYKYNDDHLFQRSFYRLKQIDLDGEFSYSATLLAFPKQEFKPFIYPSPITSSCIINFPMPAFHLTISNLSGQILINRFETISNAEKTINVLKNGTYQVVVSTSDIVFKQKIVVRK